MDADRAIPGTVTLVFECRFRSPATTQSRLKACEIILSFNDPTSPSSVVIRTPPTIEKRSYEETVVTKTKSSGMTVMAGVSYFASLRARLSHSSTERWSVIEKETQEAITRGCHEVELKFVENSQLKKGLNGVRRVSVQMDNVHGVSCIQGTFAAVFRYSVVHPFGLTTSHSEQATTSLTLTL